ncbi:MAG: TonB-dependent receptor [Acidobacteria bacterium]|nr:TonB-dependent receptor [Acidobacteriota bacterium]
MRRSLVFIASLLLVAGAAFAQETTGNVKGSVTSEDGLALPGATVTLENSKTGLERVETTDARGEFRFMALAPGSGYSVMVALDGFQTYRQSFSVTLGSTSTVNVEMKFGTFTEVMQVTAEAPLVDTTSTVTGITVGTEDINASIPLMREATQIAMLAPATIAGDPTFNTVGGGRTPGQSLVAIEGSSVAENSYQVNGLNVTNFRNGLGGSFVPFEFMEEVQVKTGGYEAEFGRATGGVINMITKSGSNTYHGAVDTYYNPKNLQEQSPDAYNAPNQAEDSELLEANASVGGAILKDKLFFYAFGTWRDSTDMTASTGQIIVDKGANPYYGGKLDWSITPSHRFEGTYFTDTVDLDRTLYGLNDDYSFSDAVGTGILSRGGENYIGKYVGIFSDNFLVSAQYGVNKFDRTDASPADSVCPYAYDSRQGGLDPLGCWVNAQGTTALDERQASRVDADLFLGNHSLRAGIDVEKATSADMSSYSGGIYYRYYLSGTTQFPQIPAGTEVVRVRHYDTGGSFDVLTNAAYVQDSWRALPNLTLNLGLRWEEFDNRNAAGESFIKITDQYAPRLGAVWDVAGNGRSKVFGSLGLYYLPIASNTNIRQAGLEFFDEAYYTFSGGVNADGSPGQLGEQLQYTLISPGTIPDPRTNRADTLDPMSQYELIIGFEQMLDDNWMIGIRGTGRKFNKVIEDITLDKALWEVYGVECYAPENIGQCAHAYRLVNPGEAFTGYYDLNDDGELDPISFTADQLGYPKPDRTYYSVELTARRRFADRWMFMGSYTWSHSYGNYEGYVNSDLGQDDAGITQTFDFAAFSEHGNGNLPNDRRHNLKLFGSYAFDFGLQVGGNASYRSGRPVNGFGVHPTDLWAQRYGSFAFYNHGEPCARGCGGTTDSVWGLDLMAKYDVKLGGMSAYVRADVFNVFNQDAVTEVDEFAEYNSSATNPDYGKAIGYQSPRRVRFGVGIKF